MTPEERQEVIHRSFQIRTVYTGKIWGGVQVMDTFMRESAEDVLLNYPDGGYDGIYAGAADELTFDDIDALLPDNGYQAETGYAGVLQTINTRHRSL